LLKPLDRFYPSIEKTAESQSGYTEKQHLLNAVYKKFFRSFDAKQSDTHGIVYTPQPIVDFMFRSVEEILVCNSLETPGAELQLGIDKSE
jgi:predicted helicase